MSSLFQAVNLMKKCSISLFAQVIKPTNMFPLYKGDRENQTDFCMWNAVIYSYASIYEKL